MKSRGQPAVAPEFGINADAESPPPMRVREGSRERPTAERHTLGGGDHSPKTALEEGIRGRQPVTAASFQPIHPSSGRYQPAPERRDEIMSDHDLKQLEASLRWLQRQEAAHGSLVPLLYFPCRGSLPPIQQVIITTAKCRWIALRLRAR